MDVKGNGQNNLLFALRRDNSYYFILSFSGSFTLITSLHYYYILNLM